MRNIHQYGMYWHIYTQHTYTQAHTYTHTYIYVYIHIHTHTHTYTHIHTQTHTHIHTQTHTHTYTHKHTHTHIHTHIHTHTCLAIERKSAVPTALYKHFCTQSINCVVASLASRKNKRGTCVDALIKDSASRTRTLHQQPLPSSSSQDHYQRFYPQTPSSIFWRTQ